jgi:hypothetical protein
MADRRVTIKLVIDDAGSVKAVKTVGEESSRTERKLKGLEGGVKKLGGSFGGLKGMLAGGIGLGGIAFGLESVVSKTREVATETEKFSSVTGIGAASSLAYTQALKARGLSGEAVTKAFGFLAKNMKSAELQETKYALTTGRAAAKGKESTAVLGRQAAAFKELGINLAGFNSESEQGKLETITKSFEAMAPGMQKTRLERELFGKGGNALSPVLEKNNLGLTHQIELVKKFYPTLQGGSKGLKEVNEKSAESKMAFEGFEFTLGQKVMPVMTKLMGTFSEVIVEVEKGKGPFGELEHTFEGIGKFGAGVVGTIKEIAGAMGVKLPMGTLGAVMAAAGLHSIKHPVKATKTVAGVTKKAIKYGEEHPERALALGVPLALGVGGYDVGKTMMGGNPFGQSATKEPHYSAGERAEKARNIATLEREAHPGAAEKKQWALEAAQYGHPTPPAPRAAPHQGGGAIPPLELKITGDGAISSAIADSFLKDTRNMRLIAEAVAIHAQKMVARK